MFGKNIKFLRKKKRITQEQLAKKLNYKSFTTIQKWEDEIAEPPLNKFKKIADLFNVSMDQLYNDDLTCNKIINNEIDKSIVNTYRKLPTEKQNELLNYANYQLSQIKTEDNIIKLNKEENYEPTTIAAHLANNKLEQDDIDAIEEAKQFVKGLKKDE